jgi:hypothetical protein
MKTQGFRPSLKRYVGLLKLQKTYFAVKLVTILIQIFWREISPPKKLRPILSQNYFGTILRYYFLAGAEIVPRNGLCDRKKKICLSTIFC